MSDILEQVEHDTVCVKCAYVVIGGSVMHCIDGKYYCAICANELRKKQKGIPYDIKQE